MLLAPVLVLGDKTPTAIERGRALRLLLRWAVSRLAPFPPRYPPGLYRPPDEPIWQDRLWWRYNVNLVVPLSIQAYLHARLSAGPDLARRHQAAARCYLENDQWIEAAWHLHQAGRAVEAAERFLEAAKTLAGEADTEALRNVLPGLSDRQLLPACWCEAQILLSDLWRKTGELKQAETVCRQALKAAAEPAQQARVYRRLGKWYEDRNQVRTLNYYRRAAECFAQAPGHPEQLDMLKDRAWLRIIRRDWLRVIRRDWAEAEADLMLALDSVEKVLSNQATPSTKIQRADIYDALANLYGRQARYEQAITYAQQALDLREERGDLRRVADSCVNLGLIYDEMGKHDQAIAAHEDALLHSAAPSGDSAAPWS